MSTLPTTPGYQFTDPQYLQVGNGNAGQFLQTDGAGNLVWANVSGGSTSNVNVTITSNIAAVTAGWAIKVTETSAGNFVIYQEPPQSFSISRSVWTTTNNSTKDAWANVQASAVNSSGAEFTFNVTQGGFNIDPSNDYVLIGTANITGAALAGIGTGATGMLSVPAGDITGTNQTNSSVPVTVRLTAGSGVVTGSSTLTNRQPVAFAVNSVSGSFPNSVVPYWLVQQAINWSVSLTQSSITSGTVVLANNNVDVQTLTSTAQTSGNSVTTRNGSSGSYRISASFAGSGLYGAGTGTSMASSTINLVTTYEPAFNKITSSSADPMFAVSDNRTSANVSFPYQISVSSIAATNTLWFAFRDDNTDLTRYSYQIETILGWTDPENDWSTTYTNRTISSGGFSRIYQVVGISGLNTTSGALNFRVLRS